MTSQMLISDPASAPLWDSIRLLVLDFDGVMTDNRVHVAEDGHESVSCSRGDGMGLELLRKRGFPVIVLSKEQNPVVAARCRKLRIECVQGLEDKLTELRAVAKRLGVEASQVAYVGNDVNDIECMRFAGLPVAVADAEPACLAAARLVTARPGGRGAVRDVCDALLGALDRASTKKDRSGKEQGGEAESDAALVSEFRAMLESRRARLRSAPRRQLIDELAWYRQMEQLLDRHMNVIAAQAYGGRHPKHWLWVSHKQFILDRVRAGERILDVGCGGSAYLLWMAQKGCRVTAWDRNPAAIELARSIMQHENLSFEVRDVTTHPPREPFDTVICSHVIEHLDDPVAVLAALRRCAGRLIVAVPPDDNRWQKVMFRDLGLPWKDDEDHRREYTPALLRSHVESAGWRITEMHAGIDIKAVAEAAGSA